jgi:hypothetical protein
MDDRFLSTLAAFDSGGGSGDGGSVGDDDDDALRSAILASLAAQHPVTVASGQRVRLPPAPPAPAGGQPSLEFQWVDDAQVVTAVVDKASGSGRPKSKSPRAIPAAAVVATNSRSAGVGGSGRQRPGGVVDAASHANNAAATTSTLAGSETTDISSTASVSAPAVASAPPRHFASSIVARARATAPDALPFSRPGHRSTPVALASPAGPQAQLPVMLSDNESTAVP